LKKDLTLCWSELKGFLPRNITKEEQKKFALKVFQISKEKDLTLHTGLFFGLKDGKVKTIDSYLMNMDNKKLYNLL
jgi:hypothetical protein